MGTGQIPIIQPQINAITRLIENPCDEPWTVYIETLLPAAGEMALTLLGFGLGDIARGYARPKGIRGGHLGRRRRPRTGIGRAARRAGIPEIGNWIGRHLPGAQEFRARSVTPGVEALWRIDGQLQKGLLAWLVADAIGDLYTDWESGLNKTIVCAREADWRLHYIGTGGSAAAITGWTSLDAPNLVYGGQFPGHGVASMQIPDAYAVILLDLHARNTFTVPQTQQIAISDGAAPLTFLAMGENQTVEPGGTGQHVLSWSGRGPRTVGFHWRVNPGFAQGLDAGHWIFVRFDQPA